MLQKKVFTGKSGGGEVESVLQIQGIKASSVLLTKAGSAVLPPGTKGSSDRLLSPFLPGHSSWLNFCCIKVHLLDATRGCNERLC